MLTTANISFLLTLFVMLLAAGAGSFCFALFYLHRIFSTIFPQLDGDAKFSFTITLFRIAFSSHFTPFVASHSASNQAPPTHICIGYLMHKTLCAFQNYLFSILKYASHTLIFTICMRRYRREKRQPNGQMANEKKLKIKHKVQAILCLHEANGKIGKVQESISGEKKLTT